ncbi:hypothetical protein JHK82_040148 [Glycine max]|nr:hypothetical protein JHK82_040148 [Glycine max]
MSKREANGVKYNQSINKDPTNKLGIERREKEEEMRLKRYRIATAIKPYIIPYLVLVWSEDLGSVNLRHELQMYSHLAALGSISLYLTLPSLTLSSTKCFGGCRFMLSVVCYIVVSQLLQHVAMLHDTIAIVPNVNFLVVLTYYD